MTQAIQVYDGDGDSRTDEQKARDLILEALRVNGDRLQRELIAKFPYGRLGEPDVMEHLKKLQKDIVDKLGIPPHLLKLK